MRQRGRPKSVQPIRDRVVPVRFTESEHGEVARAAAAEGMPLSAYLRARGVAAAKRSLRRESDTTGG